VELFEFTRDITKEADAAAERGADLCEILPILRRLSLDDFGLLLISMPNADFPHLSRLLPTMASPEVQQRWTGKADLDLYIQTAAFAKQLELAYWRHVGKPLQGAQILDFGVGYGRNLRSMLYFTDPERLWGVDPWKTSLNFSINSHVPGNLRQSDPIPTSLPVEDTQFDLIFSFSVFTHLPESALDACLRAIRRAIKPSGICVITIRPIEYWKRIEGTIGAQATDRLMQEHIRKGFSFCASEKSHDRNFGTASMDFDFLNGRGWCVAAYDTSVVDPYQVSVVLKPC
jgi:SAM-dependent methyltransferase